MKANFELFPLKGVGTLDFSTPRLNIRVLLKEYQVEEFYRTSDVRIASDYFPELGLFVYYDDLNRCEALEFTNGHSGLLFDDKNLFQIPYDDLESLFVLLDENIELEDLGFTSYKLGVGAFIADKSVAKDNPAEGIIVFKKGYYGEA